MTDLMLTSLKSYWERLRAGRIAPYRAEIDPRQFESALENMFIIEKIGENNMRIRLAGMKVCEMMGMEVRGMQPGIPHRRRGPPALSTAVACGDERTMAVVELKLEAPNRTGTYEAAMLLMPLRSDFGDINRVLGGISGRGDFFAPPLSFTITDVTVAPIEPSESTEASQPLPGFAEEQAGFGPAPTKGPQLRSIDGNPDAAGRSRTTGGTPKLRIIDGK